MDLAGGPSVGQVAKGAKGRHRFLAQVTAEAGGWGILIGKTRSEGQRRNLCGSCCVLVPGEDARRVVGLRRLLAYMPRPGSGPHPCLEAKKKGTQEPQKRGNM